VVVFFHCSSRSWRTACSRNSGAAHSCTSKSFLVDVLQKLAHGGRISIRDKLQAKKGVEAAYEELVKAMSAFLSPNQVEAYQAATRKK
jgi:hypothetical protein